MFLLNPGASSLVFLFDTLTFVSTFLCHDSSSQYSYEKKKERTRNDFLRSRQKILDLTWTFAGYRCDSWARKQYELLSAPLMNIALGSSRLMLRQLQ